MSYHQFDDELSRFREQSKPMLEADHSLKDDVNAARPLIKDELQVENESLFNAIDKKDDCLSKQQWGYLVTQVIDSGIGIEEKDMPRLFSTFNNTNQANFATQGIGLGLSTAKELCYSLGGAISIDSKKDIGTELSFSIQARDSAINLKAEDLKHEIKEFKYNFGETFIPKDAHQLINESNPQLINTNRD